MIQSQLRMILLAVLALSGVAWPPFAALTRAAEVDLGDLTDTNLASVVAATAADT